MSVKADVTIYDIRDENSEEPEPRHNHRARAVTEKIVLFVK